MTDYLDDLNQLRMAAREREWTTLQDTFKRLIANLEPLVALSIAANRATSFLPIFEAYYPEAGWVRELLLTVVSYASAPDELPEHAVMQFPSPGCGNFIRAVFDLARGVQAKYTVFERYSHITNATANAILAELSALYFAERLDEFEGLRAAQAGYQAVQYRFWTDDVVAVRDTQLWLAVADEVEAKLRS